LGLRDNVGLIVAGSQRPDFPQQTEKLLLDVAANQATIAVHEARRLKEQRLRADELDLRVAARAKELAAANEQLKREIEERRLAEEKLLQEEQELKRSEARKTAILNAALDCIVTIDHEGRIIEFNPAAERTFGYRRDEVLGSRLADVIIPPSLRDKHRDAFSRHLATGEDSVLGRRVEMTAVRADGSEFPVEVAVTRIPLHGPPSFTGYLRDITERRVSEGRWKRIVDNSAIGIAVTDLTGRFEVTNAHYQKLLGYAEEELRKMAYLDITVPDFRAYNSTLMSELLEGRRDQFNIEKQYRRKDGRLVWVRNNVSLLPGADGAPHNIMAIVEDISERKAAEESLNLTQTRLARAAQVATAAELSASIAHEVNQPLLGIITNASTCLRMLAADPPNVDGARETARRMIRDGNRAAEVVKRLRALFGKKAATRETVDLNDAAREVVALSSSDLKRARVLVQADLADGLPPVTGNRVQLQQVILNLLRNASDAMSDVDDRPRRLLIKTQRDADDRVRLAVQDTGVGFDPDAAERLFESFFTTKNSGMGIGLSVSRSIIESHRGRLWMEPNEGPGVTFSFSIPRQSEQPAGVHSVDAAVSPAAAS
jgi:PAS domain S-box-containing protein